MSLQAQPPRGLVRWLPSTLLVLGVVIFALFVSSARAVTWTGPGFSMFSAADYRATRFVHLSLGTPEGWVPARLFPTDELDNVVSVPTDSNGRALAVEALNHSWYVVDGVLQVNPPDDVDAPAVPVVAARVQVWTATVRSGHLWPELILELELER